MILKGTLFGTAAVVTWAAYLAFSRAGVDQGMLPQDFALLRYGIAALVMLPWILRHGVADLGGVGWRRGAVLALFAGPLFIALGTGGLVFAPLSHNAVIQPSTATLVTMLIGWLVLKETMTPLRATGTLLLVLGLGIVVQKSVGGTAAMPNAVIGDVMFVGAGLCWVGFTLALRQWQVPGIAATAAVSLISACVTVPLFFLLSDLSRLAALPTATLLIQAFAHGIAAGVLALIAFGKAVEILGATRAALFPAMVPVCTLVLGIPIAGEIPGPQEALGAIVASTGLAIALGALDPLLRRKPG